jgi:hypothetical protein
MMHKQKLNHRIKPIVLLFLTSKCPARTIRLVFDPSLYGYETHLVYVPKCDCLETSGEPKAIEAGFEAPSKII